jgi:hypothetical protein
MNVHEETSAKGVTSTRLLQSTKNKSCQNTHITDHTRRQPLTAVIELQRQLSAGIADDGIDFQVKLFRGVVFPGNCLGQRPVEQMLLHVCQALARVEQFSLLAGLQEPDEVAGDVLALFQQDEEREGRLCLWGWWHLLQGIRTTTGAAICHLGAIFFFVLGTSNSTGCLYRWLTPRLG